MKKCLVSQKAFCTGQQDDFSPNPQQPSSTSLPSSANLVASWCWNSLWPFASMPMRKKKNYTIGSYLKGQRSNASFYRRGHQKPSVAVISGQARTRKNPTFGCPSRQGIG